MKKRVSQKMGRGLILLLLGVACLAGCSGLVNMTSKATDLRGKPAPNLFKGTWINSEPLPMQDLRGQVVLIEFWHASCSNCRATVADLNSMFEKYRDYPFQIISVHPLETEDEVALLESKVFELGIRYPVVTDVGRNSQARYVHSYFPAMFLVDKKGVVRYTHEGRTGWSSVQEWVDKLLAEPAR